jgi:hypothetical protein
MFRDFFSENRAVDNAEKYGGARHATITIWHMFVVC